MLGLHGMQFNKKSGKISDCFIYRNYLSKISVQICEKEVHITCKEGLIKTIYTSISPKGQRYSKLSPANDLRQTVLEAKKKKKNRKGTTIVKENRNRRTSLVTQWLRTCASTAGAQV